MLVDEFQDTNPNQYELIKLLCGDRRSITVVGDDDQAIYSWRGASVRFLFDYERDFPGTRIIKLEQNYRSTPEILELRQPADQPEHAAQGQADVVGQRTAATRCSCCAAAPRKRRPRRSPAWSSACKASNPELFPLAILYRINSQSLALETEFLKQHISFRILKGLRFFERKEIRDSLALLRLALNPADDLAFLRLVDFLPLGIGSKTLESLKVLAKAKDRCRCSRPWSSACPTNSIRGRCFPVLRQLQPAKGRAPGLRDLCRPAGAIGIPGHARAKKPKKNGCSTSAELREFIGKWEAENPGAPFSDLLDRMSLETRETRGRKRRQVFLLTMHNAKGLEFPTVIVSGINSAYMPFFLRKEREEIEEERRLFYVASTRASQLLVVSTASDRPSFFLQQIAACLLPARVFVPRDHRRHFPRRAGGGPGPGRGKIHRPSHFRARAHRGQDLGQQVPDPFQRQGQQADRHVGGQGRICLRRL